MEFRSDVPNVFICHMGVERSRAAAEALKEQGHIASHIPGGTSRIKKMTSEDIRRLIPEEAKVKVIYDPGSSTVEYENLIAATNVLEKAGIKWKQLSTVDLECALLTLGIKLKDYYY